MTSIVLLVVVSAAMLHFSKPSSRYLRIEDEGVNLDYLEGQGYADLLDSTYAKYFPLANGLSCRMDQFVENHGAVGYRGVVKNESSTPYLNLVLLVCGYDSSGELLAAMELAVGRVAPNDVGRFESMLNANYWKFDKFSVDLKKAVPEDRK